MDKVKPIKRSTADQERTKLKIQQIRVDANEKPTLAIKNKMNNSLTNKLITQSSFISEQQSISAQESSEEVFQIDRLCIEGRIQNLKQMDESFKKKYSISSGLVFDVGEYRIIFAGRHQVNFANGMPVMLYIPPVFKSSFDVQTKKIQVLIERKMKNNEDDVMQYPYIIVDPYNSLYPTYICSWIECKRKITLQHYIQYQQQTNQFMILGNAIHRYLEWLIRKQVQPEAPSQNELIRLYQSFLYDMYLLDMSFQTFTSRVQTGVTNLAEWYLRYAIKGNKIQLNKWDKKFLKITKVIGSQVMIKSKYFGIRGKMDGLFQGQYIDEKENTKFLVSVPFQLKTGKKVLDSHKKQIDLYNILLRQNRNMPVLGLLYYSQSNLLDYRVQNPMVCFQNINIHRNKIIINILNLYSDPLVLNLPGLPETFDKCKMCDVSIQCAVTRLEPHQFKDIQDIDQNTPEGYNIQIKQQLKKMTVIQMQYLKKWTSLLHLQECEEKKTNQDNRKKCFYNKLKVQIAQLQKFVNYQVGQTLRITLVKQIQNHQMSDQIDNYFKISQKLRIFIPVLRLADCCRIIKNEKTTKTFKMQIQIKTDNIKFNKNKCIFLLQQNQSNFIDVQLQKYENSFYNYTRGYCYKFVAEAEDQLKKIVIQESYEKQNISIKQCAQQPQLASLNEDQQSAFKRCILFNRFCLVQGMPGTGKTQLILKLIQYFFRKGKTVLVTSFTNQSLSNILDRQINIENKIPSECIIRQGSRYGISAQYQYLSSQSQSQKTLEDYKNYFKIKKIWFVTISSLYIHHLPKKFDVVIVDQASQCLEPSCLQALSKADKFILIGDDKQLQPVVKSKQAVNRGMNISLFERLCAKYGDFKTVLKKQYRMHPQIMNLTNKLVYDDQLGLANKQIKQRKLKIQQNWQKKVPAYLHNIINPCNSVRFVNYDSALNIIGTSDKLDIRKIQRFLQLKIACSIYKHFRNIGVARQNILIISAFNSLVHQIVSCLKNQKIIDQNNSDVLTIDKSQGTDKEVIIFIFHKGNKQLVQNFRRLNVALTRAKNKFIIVGSCRQLSQLTTWTGRLVQLLIPHQINVQRQFLQGLLQGFQEIDLT